MILIQYLCRKFFNFLFKNGYVKDVDNSVYKLPNCLILASSFRSNFSYQTLQLMHLMLYFPNSTEIKSILNKQIYCQAI